jgi:hypothetical protein
MAEPGVARRSGSAMLLSSLGAIETNGEFARSRIRFRARLRQALRRGRPLPHHHCAIPGIQPFVSCKLSLGPAISLENPMKSAYELAMERLQKDAPSVPLNAEQRAQIAEIDSLYTAKIAEKDLLLKSEIAQEQARGKFDQVEQLQKQLASELRRLNQEREEKKEKVRRDGK